MSSFETSPSEILNESMLLTQTSNTMGYILISPSGTIPPIGASGQTKITSLGGAYGNNMTINSSILTINKTGFYLFNISLIYTLTSIATISFQIQGNQSSYYSQILPISWTASYSPDNSYSFSTILNVINLGEQLGFYISQNSGDQITTLKNVIITVSPLS